MRHRLFGPLLALAPDAPGGAGGTGDPPAPPEGTVTMTRAALDALINGAVEKATGPLRSQIETWQKAALDQTWDGVFREHNIDPEVGGLLRERWERLQPAEGEHRPDPAKWAPEQPYFAKLKPAAPPPAEPAKTSGKAPAQAPAASVSAPAAPKPPPVAPPAPALPSYLTRGPNQPAAAPPAGPAATPAAALKVAVEAARAAEGV